jgi:hypothetical protein
MTSPGKKILLALTIVFVAIFVALGVLGSYMHQAAERAGNETATTQNIKTIAAVEVQFFNTHDRTFATIDQLVQADMLSMKFAAHPPVADGYLLTLKLNKPDEYSLAADPVDRSSGRNHFYFDSASEQIHVNPDDPAGPNDPLQ